MPWPLPHRRSPAPVAIRRVASALMAMEALVQPRHIKVSRRFYVAQSFHPAMGDVLAGPFQTLRWTRQIGSLAGQPAHQSCNGSREGSTSYCPAIRNIRGRPPEGEGEAGATRAKTRPASLPLRGGLTSLHGDAGRRPEAG
jgi:hypothetical protein